MKFPGLTVLAFLLGTVGLAAADQPAPVYPNIVDETGLMSDNKEYMQATQANLTSFETDSGGIKTYVQFLAKAPPAGQGKDSLDFMRALATKLGVRKNGIVAVHFGEDPDWRLWIGDDLAAKFVGKPAPDAAALSEAKQALLKTAVSETAKGMATLGEPTTGPDAAPLWSILRFQFINIMLGLNAKFVPDGS